MIKPFCLGDKRHGVVYLRRLILFISLSLSCPLRGLGQSLYSTATPCNSATISNLKTNEGVNVRPGPSRASGDKITQLTSGSLVRVLSVQNGETLAIEQPVKRSSKVWLNVEFYQNNNFMSGYVNFIYLQCRPEKITREDLMKNSASTIHDDDTATEGTKPIGAQTKKIFVLIFDPIIRARGNQKLSEVLDWYNPVDLNELLIKKIHEVSHGLVNYVVSERIDADEFTTYLDGFKYDEKSFLTAWSGGKKFSHGDNGSGTPMMNYLAMLRKYQVCEKFNSGLIDELWIWGFPYSGLWESNLTGTGSYWLNSQPTLGSSCKRALPIMGFNHERALSEALHSYGHRIEFTMAHIYGNWQRNDRNAWNKFTIRDKDIRGRSQCGDVHIPPNGTADYDYANPKVVNSACDGWFSYPNTGNVSKAISCQAWNCTQQGYMEWWLKHLPHVPGQSVGKENNWWKYILSF